MTHLNDNISSPFIQRFDGAQGHDVGDGARQAQETAPKTPKNPGRRSGALLCAKLSPFVTLGAWVVLLLPYDWSGYLGLALSVTGIVLGILGLKSPTRFWHEISLTSLIAASILTLVIVAFLALLAWILKI